MSKSRKKAIRREFRDSVFERDGYKCVICGKQASKENAESLLDAHHITPREEMPNGGYVKENGATLCDPSKTGGSLTEGCHYRAEMVLKKLALHGEYQMVFLRGDPDYPYAPVTLYEKTNSSYEKAMRASESLK